MPVLATPLAPEPVRQVTLTTGGPRPAPHPRRAADLLAALLRRGQPLPALTVCQPYAELLLGPKRVENRTRNTGYRGLVAVHAGKGRDWLRRAPADHLARLRRPVGELEFGAVVGVAWVRDSVELRAVPAGERWLTSDPFASGPWCWLTAWAVRLDEPVPCDGRLGLWRLDAEAAGRVLASLIRTNAAAA